MNLMDQIAKMAQQNNNNNGGGGGVQNVQNNQFLAQAAAAAAFMQQQQQQNPLNEIENLKVIYILFKMLVVYISALFCNMTYDK